jgi:hypothetical protein
MVRGRTPAFKQQARTNHCAMPHSQKACHKEGLLTSFVESQQSRAILPREV